MSKFLSIFEKAAVKYAALGTLIFVIAVILTSVFFSYNPTFNIKSLVSNSKEPTLQEQLASVSAELKKIQEEDQVQKNIKLEEEIKTIQDNYKQVVTAYETVLDLKAKKVNTTALEKQYNQIVKYLSERNLTEATKSLAALNKTVADENAKLAPKAPPPPPATAANQNAPTNNTPPGSGYSRQSVQTEIGNYTVDIVSADLNSTKVIVDTASEADCGNECPVLSLGDYVSRNGAFAGINGSYFCPEAYPSCAGKTNSFDTLLMNKNKVYFNSDNNVYSTVPAAIFSPGSARYVGQSQQWGRDTSVDAVIANYPLLLSGGNNLFAGSDDPKQGSKGARSFIGSTGSTVYIGVVHNVTVAEMGIVLKAMGLQDVLNLDSGGSTALWSSGYKVGPGRNIPNAVLFVGR